MRSSVYLFAAAFVAATSAPAFASELIIGDTAVIVYEDAYAEPQPEWAYGDVTVSGDAIVYADDGVTVQPDYIAASDDQIIYIDETAEPVYAVDGIEAGEDVMMTETIDGIVYETIAAPAQTY